MTKRSHHFNLKSLSYLQM